MPPRMANPSLVVPDALPPLLDLTRAIGQTGVPQRTLDLIRIRVSQLNGRPMDKAGEEEDRLLVMVDGWPDEPGFSPPERAALALTEVVTRLSDQPNPVPDEIWAEADRHYTEVELGALIIQIGLVNLWNRINITAQERPGSVASRRW